MAYYTFMIDGSQWACMGGATLKTTADAYYNYLTDVAGYGGTVKYAVTRTRAGG